MLSQVMVVLRTAGWECSAPGRGRRKQRARWGAAALQPMSNKLLAPCATRKDTACHLLEKIAFQRHPPTAAPQHEPCAGNAKGPLRGSGNGP